MFCHHWVESRFPTRFPNAIKICGLKVGEVLLLIDSFIYFMIFGIIVFVSYDVSDGIQSKSIERIYSNCKDFSRYHILGDYLFPFVLSYFTFKPFRLTKRYSGPSSNLFLFTFIVFLIQLYILHFIPDQSLSTQKIDTLALAKLQGLRSGGVFDDSTIVMRDFLKFGLEEWYSKIFLWNSSWA